MKLKMARTFWPKPAPEFTAFQRAVLDNWKLIDAAVTHEVALVAENALPPNRASAFDGGSPQRNYGSGYWGVPYPTAFPRWTVKVTVDPLEGPIAQYILDTDKLRDHPGVARFLKVWRVRQKVKLATKSLVMYVIVRENIEPIALSELPERGVNALNAHIDAVSDYLDSIYDARRSHDDLDVAEFREEWLDLVKEITRIPMLEHVGKFMLLIEHLGPIIMHDVTVQNLGWRKHSFADFAPQQGRVSRSRALIHDVGHSSNGIGLPVIDVLPTLERNPPIPYLDEFEES